MSLNLQIKARNRLQRVTKKRRKERCLKIKMKQPKALNNFKYCNEYMILKMDDLINIY